MSQQLELMIDELKSNFILSQTHMNVYSMKRDSLINFLEKIFFTQLQDSDDSSMDIVQNFSFLNRTLDEVIRIIHAEDYSKKKSKLSLITRTF
jgi:hypothetical protein